MLVFEGWTGIIVYTITILNIFASEKPVGQDQILLRFDLINLHRELILLVAFVYKRTLNNLLGSIGAICTTRKLSLI